ncbi:MAG: segregation and condensation protein B [Parcubacteria group bacterium Athens1014_10]|nr:MAG: segregation and condensation protein B [Parcubacteria group bacterium Athens1014_10]TSD04990.1 MAG: segregation and condensation protein B [Parcubacteria group bacterium Athens0714_12]
MPQNLKSRLESLLFISSQPISLKRLAHLLEAGEDDIEKTARELLEEYKSQNRGIQITENGKKIEMVTHPENAKLVQNFLKEELSGELTPVGLETLTIIAYRGPISKLELEQIRGVNCSLILRNLMIKGLIEEERDEKMMAIKYRATLDFMHYLGINKIEELPDYQNLHNHENLVKLLEKE